MTDGPITRCPDDLLLLHHFRINLDLDVISNHRFTRPEKVVVDQIEIPAVDVRCRGNSAARITPGIAHFRSRSINVERDFTCGSVDGQIANYLQLPAAAYHPFGLEVDGRVLFDVKEIRASKIFVPRLNPGIDRTDVDAGRHLRLRNVLLVQDDASRHLRKTPSYIRDRQVTHGKLRGRVRRVNFPGGSLRKRR